MIGVDTHKLIALSAQWHGAFIQSSSAQVN